MWHLISTIVLVVAGQTSDSSDRFAETAADREHSAPALTLEDCIGIALANQPAIQMQRSGVAAAQQQERIARSFYFPQLRFDARYTNIDEPVTVDFQNPVSGSLADVSADGAAFFGIARAAGSATALAALDNPNVSVAPGVPPFNVASQAARDQLPGLFRTGLLGENSLTTDFLLTQPIWTGGKIHFRHQQAKLGVSVANADLVQSRQQTVFEVARAFHGVQLARTLQDVTRRAEEDLEFVEIIVEGLNERGHPNVDRIDVHRARSTRLLAGSQVARADRGLETALAALRQAMGMHRFAEFEVADDGLPRDRYDLDLTALQDIALRNRPEVQQTRYGRQAAELDRDIARADYLPDVGLFGRFATVHDDRDFPNPNDQQDEQWAVGITIGVPLFTGGRLAAQRGKADQDAARAYHLHRRVIDLVTLQVEQSYQQYREAQERLGVLAEAVEQASAAFEGLSIQRMGFDFAREEASEHYEDRVETRLLLLQLEAEYHQTLYAYNLALAELTLAIGSDVLPFPPVDVVPAPRLDVVGTARVGSG